MHSVLSQPVQEQSRLGLRIAQWTRTWGSKWGRKKIREKKKQNQNKNKNKPYGIHTEMPLKQPQTFLLPQAANVVKQLLGWGTSKVHWEQQFYFSIKHRNRAFSPPSLPLSLSFFFWMKHRPGFLISKTLFRFAWPLHNLKRSSETSKRNCESYGMKKTFLYFIKVKNCCIPCLWNLHEWALRACSWTLGKDWTSINSCLLNHWF